MIAAIRFGLGPRPDDQPMTDPAAALKAQLRTPPPALPMPDGWERMPTVTDGLSIWRQDDLTPVEPGKLSWSTQFYRLECTAQVRTTIASATPFRERLVMFWTNHLTVSTREGSVRVLAGDYVRTVIRPHVIGSFADMLVASVRHPAMLLYLNQSSSVGPNSPLGLRQKRGLNENLAREILELHTLSPAAGYTQADVTEFARLLTGLMVERFREPIGARFQPEAHEPGAKTILGKRFDEGPDQIEAALRWLAGHEATHRHLARKLARHFVADAPPPAVVDRLFAVLRDSGGDLGLVAEALVDTPEAWAEPLGKIRTAQDFIFASHRLLSSGPDLSGLALGNMINLSQDLWAAPAPIGWPDTAADWMHPEAAIQRMEIAYNLAGRFSRLNPNDMLDIALGPLARAETIQAVRRAGSPRDGLTLLMASPEFQRR